LRSPPCQGLRGLGCAARAERADVRQAAKMHIYVRRGGPNYQKGLQLMRELGSQVCHGRVYVC
jgi:hypothetical protein